ncbi:hypothetical protein LPW11_01050 [Geomonas sp. RF6]|uniref:hypothetical protein n=1 Tax=Geomonas sp. RF6 TaxID=2897342 RepID=UPI001E36C0CD|nr:hypothetical protein [Geomonas sp. RF6]UFS70790.1 hypothetical protein LPW11_01050 [Geomonas sp. RF6]
MDEKLQRAVYAAGNDPEIAGKLDQVLSGENDRAFIVCSFEECENNTRGRCTIFAIKDVPKMKRTTPCEHYVARTPAIP